MTAAVLMGLVAAFQVALAAGAPWGAYAYGGRQLGRLPPALRVSSAVAALILVLAAWIVLARGHVIAASPLPRDVLPPATWVVVLFLALNTLSNLAGRTPIERYGFGGITAVLIMLVGYVAIAST